MLPIKLRQSLEGSSFEPVTLGFASAVTLILNDNSMPFFPAYTDHGLEHIGSVLEAAARLVPEDVFSQGLMTSADAATLVCGTLLHDLALHLRESGFRELIDPATRFEPLAWFDAQQGERGADEPWPALWRAFQKEARHFTQSQLDRLLGPENDGVPEIALAEDLGPPGAWTQSDRLLVGEFLRRHHARLAHEIAIYGFPGAGTEFPCLSTDMPDLADAAGLVARSHNEPMRVCLAYLSYLQPGNQRPCGALVPYLIGLMRIADYFQLESSRAPALLLHLKDPQSPQSLEEWEKHRAVRAISWQTTDPLAIYIEVAPTQGLHTYLQLAELLRDLQQELDTTTAVLSETYRTQPLSSLRLAYQRIRTNLTEPSLEARLPFVPRRAALGSAEDLFRLVIRDLYGNQPSVAGRELIQNAVDAVRERRRWEAQCARSVEESAFRTQDADVELTLSEGAEGVLLRIADRGIGMTPEIIVKYFLKAGATFGLSSGEPDLNGEPTAAWLKAGRFGVGAFAAFLFGSEIRVKTRHLTADRGVGFTARIDDDLVQLNWMDLPFGTEIVVPLDPVRVPVDLTGQELESFFEQVQSFYRLADPTAIFRLIRDGDEMVGGGRTDVPTQRSETFGDWTPVPVAQFDSVMWRATEPSIDFVYNGITIENLAAPAGSRPIYQWSDSRIDHVLKPPDVAVFDSHNRLGVSLSRYQLTDRRLPFERDLLHSIGCDVIARTLVTGSMDHALGKGWGLVSVFTREGYLPFVPSLVQSHLEPSLCVLWVAPDSRRKEEELFVDARRGPSWHDLPIRVVLEPPRALRTYKMGQSLAGGLNLVDIDTGVRLLTRLLNCTPVASVCLSRGGDLHKEAEGKPPWEVLPSGEPDDDDDAGRYAFQEEGDYDEEEYMLALVNEACWRSDENLATSLRLLRIADELVSESGTLTLGISVMRPRAGAHESPDPISEVWESVIGGYLSRDIEQREDLMRSIRETNEELRPLIDRSRSDYLL